MKPQKAFWIVLLIIIVLGSSYARAQSLVAKSAGPSPVRDQSALNVLEHAFTVAGGKAQIKAAQDFSATGTITYSWSDGDVQGDARILAKGQDQARMDVRLPDRTDSIILNHGTGSVSDHSGSHAILGQNARHMGLLIFMLPHIVEAVEDPRTSISFDAGNDDMGCNDAYRIQIVQPIPTQLQNDLKLQQLRTFKLCIEKTSLMIVQFAHPLVLANRRHVVLVRQLVFSDFRMVSGLVLPFSIEEKQGGQHLSTLHLGTCSLSSGVQPDAFDR
ncbi:MAG: hypothetical protein LAO76_26580 [Acidobacteriia bacterium]|nr:hypothetical protein [Terriglobia bacterium]